MATINYRTADVEGLKVFYREAGRADAPMLLLLHGFPSAGHMFRELMPQLAEQFHVVAPDLPGFGQSDMPGRDKFHYTFDNIARVIDRFTEIVSLKRFAIYVFDYGAPTGFRLALKHPERIAAIISQNGNAYEEGLSQGWNPIRAYWTEASEETGRHCVLSSLPKQRSGSIRTASPIRPWFRRTDTPSTTSTWRVPGRMKFSSISSETTKATSRYIPNSRAISANTSRRFWRCGARTIPSSCQLVRRHSNATCRTLMCASLIPATLRWRHTATKSHQRSESFWSLQVKRRGGGHKPVRNKISPLVTLWLWVRGRADDSRLLQEKQRWCLRH